MKRFVFWVAPLLLCLTGCEFQDRSRPQAGDIVSPDLVSAIKWQQGRKGNIRVRLTATDTQGDERMLGFQAMGGWKNPTADVEFFDAAGATLDTQQVDLNHRC